MSADTGDGDNCSAPSTDALLALGIPTSDSDSYYSCATASNASRLAHCCSPSPVNAYESDPCYSWCDLDADLNAQFDSSSTGGDDNGTAFSYMRRCLDGGDDSTNSADASVPLYCRAKPHVVVASATTTAATPTSTFDTASFCRSEWPPDETQLAGLFSPQAGCAMLENATNYHVLNRCCQPAPVQYSVLHCYVYCRLPRGSGFRGDGNLTADVALGSFKACMLEYAGGLSNESLFDGIYCSANESRVWLNQSDFGTTKYLTGAGAGSTPLAHLWAGLLPLLIAFWALFS